MAVEKNIKNGKVVSLVETPLSSTLYNQKNSNDFIDMFEDVNLLNIEDIIGKKCINIHYYERFSDITEVYFEFSDGVIMLLHHNQDCCEYIYLESGQDELDILIDTEIMLAEKITNRGNVTEEDLQKEIVSCTWTFYKFRTIKGDCTLRWVGKSNGCYSEDVDVCFMRVKN